MWVTTMTTKTRNIHTEFMLQNENAIAFRRQGGSVAKILRFLRKNFKIMMTYCRFVIKLKQRILRQQSWKSGYSLNAVYMQHDDHCLLMKWLIVDEEVEKVWISQFAFTNGNKTDGLN